MNHAALLRSLFELAGGVSWWRTHQDERKRILAVYAQRFRNVPEPLFGEAVELLIRTWVSPGWPPAGAVHQAVDQCLRTRAREEHSAPAGDVPDAPRRELFEMATRALPPPVCEQCCKEQPHVHCHVCGAVEDVPALVLELYARYEPAMLCDACRRQEKQRADQRRDRAANLVRAKARALRRGEATITEADRRLARAIGMDDLLRSNAVTACRSGQEPQSAMRSSRPIQERPKPD